MVDLAGHVRDYLELRRALGFKLVFEGYVLPGLATFIETAGASTLTTELAISWARQPKDAQPITLAHRLGAARGFARYLKTIDPATEIPPLDVFRARQQRPATYLWPEQEITALLEATRQLRPELRAATYVTLLGLIAVTGMRLGEATRLQRQDVNLTDGILTITEAKFDRSRLIPLHPSTTTALSSYAQRRDRLCPTPRSAAFFLSHAGTMLRVKGVDATFNDITTGIGRGEATHPRSQAQFRRPDADRLAPDGNRYRSRHGCFVHLSRPCQPGRDLLVPLCCPRTDGIGCRTAGPAIRGAVMTALAPTLQAFFTDRLLGQRGASSHTVDAYRTTFRLLLGYASDKLHKPPSGLDIGDLDAPLVAAFLIHLETNRHNSVRTRNNRLAAIHSLFTYAALRHPEHAASIQRVLAIGTKRFDRNLVTFLTEAESDALLSACNKDTWTGRRDHAMILLAIQTGLRISELTGLSCADVSLGAGANIHCIGKGRKERRTPLVPSTVGVLRAWLRERGGSPADPLFPTSTGRKLSRDAIEHRITRNAAMAGSTCPSMKKKHVSTHTLRHTAAMRLLLSGVDVTVIALWLGHSQVSSTNAYLHTDMSQKERAIARVTPPESAPGRYRPPDPILAFLEAL